MPRIHPVRLLLALLLGGCADRPAEPPSPPVQALTSDTTLAPAAAPQKLSVAEIPAGELPGGLDYDGNLIAARRWKDQMGDNVLLLTLADPIAGPCNPETNCGVNQDMYGYHYLVGGGAGHTLVWRTNDFIRDCELDMEFAVRPDPVSVTDLDGDGIAESTYMYMMACRGDVSPGTLKLIMHEGAAKYAVRGFAELNAGPMHVPSEMTLDRAFDQAPPAFRTFAIGHWRRYQDMDFWSRPAEDR